MDKPLSQGAIALFNLLETQPRTIQQLIDLTEKSDKMIRIYLKQLKDRGLLKELASLGRTKLYARIDYIPQLDESRPLAQRWQVYAPFNRRTFSVGELATIYGEKLPIASVQAAELLVKTPAWLIYLAQDKELSTGEKAKELEKLREVTKEAIDQLQSAISVLNQLVTDPRYWDTSTLSQLNGAPDFVLNKDLAGILNRLTEENES